MHKPMNDINPNLPSLKSLLIASAFAVLLAIVILILAVLPAEYGIDITGFGKKMGLTTLSIQTEATNYSPTTSCPPLSTLADNQGQSKAGITKKQTQPQWQYSININIPAGKGLEYKFYLVKGEILEYSWTTNGAKLYFDFHGEPKDDKTGYFESFRESTDNQSNGTLTAHFDGPHGWYWENKTREQVTLVLKTKGSYRILGFM